MSRKLSHSRGEIPRSIYKQKKTANSCPHERNSCTNESKGKTFSLCREQKGVALQNEARTRDPSIDKQCCILYLCEEDSLTYPMHYSAYNGNIFKPAPSKSQRTAGQAEETGQNLFERCIYAMLLLREKRVVLSPMLERTAVCGK